MSVGRTVEYQKLVMVDGEEYKFHAIRPSDAIPMLKTLMQFAVEPATVLAAAGGKEDQVMDLLPRAAKALISNFHAPEVVALIKRLLDYTTYNNKAMIFDEHFQGRLGHLVYFLIAALEYQFKDFTVAIRKGIADVLTSVKAQ